MEKAFGLHIDKNFPFVKDANVLLGISGGIDSVALCHLLARSDVNFSLAHCNFRLRGSDSDQDEKFVKSLSKSLNKTLFVKSFNTIHTAEQEGISIQMAARDLRYAWFLQLMSEKKFDYLMTAHHADDNLETFLINLSRGSGLKGLCGIPEKENQIIRPLLRFSRLDIENFAIDNKLTWRTDQSNDDQKYLRNQIRKQITPRLKELHPKFLHSFQTSIDNLKGSQSIVEEKMNEVLKSIVRTDKADSDHLIRFDLKKLEPYTDQDSYLYELFYKYGFRNWADIRSLCKAQSGKQVLSNTHRLVKHGKDLILGEILTLTKEDSFEISKGQQILHLDQFQLVFDPKDKPDAKSTLATFDKDLLRFPLLVRKWKKGDYFYPIGMKGRKKLSKYFKDEKFSLFQKENIWLLCSGNDVIWVIGKRIDDRYKITDQTNNIYHIVIQQ